MQVQNKLQLVTAQLPPTVQNTGITVAKASSGFLMVAAFVSTDGRMSTNDLADYVNRPSTTRSSAWPASARPSSSAPGYAMRIWLDPADAEIPWCRAT